jgi:hypothetical protein
VSNFETVVRLRADGELVSVEGELARPDASAEDLALLVRMIQRFGSKHDGGDLEIAMLSYSNRIVAVALTKTEIVALIAPAETKPGFALSHVRRLLQPTEVSA